jgi:hypothetical protein
VKRYRVQNRDKKCNFTQSCVKAQPYKLVRGEGVHLLILHLSLHLCQKTASKSMRMTLRLIFMNIFCVSPLCVKLMFAYIKYSCFELVFALYMPSLSEHEQTIGLESKTYTQEQC